MWRNQKVGRGARAASDDRVYRNSPICVFVPTAPGLITPVVSDIRKKERLERSETVTEKEKSSQSQFFEKMCCVCVACLFYAHTREDMEPVSPCIIVFRIYLGHLNANAQFFRDDGFIQKTIPLLL